MDTPLPRGNNSLERGAVTRTLAQNAFHQHYPGRAHLSRPAYAQIARLPAPWRIRFCATSAASTCNANLKKQSLSNLSWRSTEPNPPPSITTRPNRRCRRAIDAISLQKTQCSTAS